MTKKLNVMTDLANIFFGVEVEMSMPSRYSGTSLLADGLREAGVLRAQGSSCAHDTQGRVWNIVSDCSVSGSVGFGGELVCPPLTVEDIETLQTVLRVMRRGGCKSSARLGCGIHIHIDGAYMTGADHTVNPLNGRRTSSVGSDMQAVIRLLKTVHAHDAQMQAMLGNSTRRNYCRPISESYVKRMKGVKSFDQLKVAIVDDMNGGRGTVGRPSANDRAHFNNVLRRADYQLGSRYPSARYAALNLCPLASKGTVEFRLFNGTLHAGKVRAYILWALAMAHFAKNATRVSSKQKAVSNNMKYDCRTWLNRLGMIGDDFKTARLHLVGRKSLLEGNSSRAGHNNNETQLAA